MDRMARTACLGTASSVIIGRMERFFFWWGCVVSRHPGKVILGSLLLVGLASTGLLNFRMEHKANQLWIPPDSVYNQHQDWLNTHFKKARRTELIIIRSENVLTPQSIQKMMEVHRAVQETEAGGETFGALCTRVPIADPFLTRRRRNAEARLEQAGSGMELGAQRTKEGEGGEEYEDEYDYDVWDEYPEYPAPAAPAPRPRIDFAKFGSRQNLSLTAGLPEDIHCGLVTTLADRCAEFSLLEAWRFDPVLVASATQEEILSVVNLLQRSPVYGHDTDFASLLGGVTRNASGHIVGAAAARMFWSIQVPEGAAVVESQGHGTELELGDATSLAWEEGFVAAARRLSGDEVEVLPNAISSYGNESERAVLFDGSLMVGGFCLMFLYTLVMLGRPSALECRLWLSLAGISAILLGLIVSLGLGSALSLPYTPIHAILPFLCLGIGIDDMFVIMQCLANLKRDPASLELSVPELIGSALRHAGVSLTVTSVTDVLAFGVGAVTVMPGLQSFCVSTALGLAAIFLLQLSWFTAWLALDEGRIRARRHSLLPCLSVAPPALVPRSEAREGLVSRLLGPLLPRASYRLLVAGTAAGLLAVGAWGAVSIQQRFDHLLLIPQDSYLARFIQVNDQFYRPYDGWTAEVYTGPLAPADLPALHSLVTELRGLAGPRGPLVGVSGWWTEFGAWAEREQGRSWRQLASPDTFPSALSRFLHSTDGARYQADLRLAGPLACGVPAPAIIASRLAIEYRQLQGPTEHGPARRAVEAAIARARLSSTAFSHVKVYAAWETDQIIGAELWRNVLLAMACVTAVVSILLANLRICLLVILAIVLTLVDVIGFLHFWGITIDIISCINIVLAIGLCVDYSVHICHAFLVARGSRTERAVTAVDTIGPAVLNGGVTTFLALVLLAGSTSHTFLTFFKVFLLTVIFGLFHGLVLLPVLLSMVGPQPPDPEGDLDSTASSSSTASSVVDDAHSTGPQPQPGVVGQAWAHLFAWRHSWSPTAPACGLENQVQAARAKLAA